MAPYPKTTVIEIYPKISLVTADIFIVLYRVWQMDSAPKNALRDLQVVACFMVLIKDITHLLLNR